MADKQPKPSKGDYNALSFLVKEFCVQAISTHKAAKMVPVGPSIAGLPTSCNGWGKRFRRLIALGWMEDATNGWYAITDEGRKVEEAQPF